MAPAPAWPQRGQAQRSLQQGREGGCARGGLCGCSVGSRSHTWALRAGNTALPPCLGAATLPGRCHPARVLPQVPEQRGPWWMAGKLGDSALASGACCDVSGSILSVRAATKPCGGVKSPPLQLSSAVGTHAVRCTGAVPCVWLGSDHGVVMLLGNHKPGMRCPEPRLCYPGRDEASTASAWLGAACRAAPCPTAALEAVGTEQPQAKSSSLGSGCQHTARV